jgi:PAS domain S-box-containing protein
VEPTETERSDGQFAALAESAPDAILTIDAQSTILSANPATERIFGWSPDELVGRPLTVLIPERYRPQHAAGVARYLRTGRRNISWTGIPLPGLTKDGREIPLEISFGEFVDDRGRHVFSGFVRDVSERLRYQREIEAARAAAEQALRDVARLGRITDVALVQDTYDEMLAALLRGLRTELDADAAAVLLLDEGRDTLSLRAADGLAMAPDEYGHFPLGGGVAGRVAARGAPLVVDDLPAFDPGHPLVREGFTSFAAVPIGGERETIGVVHVATRDARPFGDADVRLLEIVAARMAGVFARTRLYEAERQARTTLAEREAELQRLNAMLETRAREERALRTLAQSITAAVRVAEVMHQIAEGALTVSGAAGAYVEQVVDDGEVEVVASAGEHTPPIGQRVPYPGSLTEELIERREPALLLCMEGVGEAMAPYLDRACHGCSALVVPLIAEASTLGALVLLRRPDETPLDEEVVGRVRTLGDLASLSLQRLVALAESERRRAEAEAAVRSRDEVLSVVSHDLRNPVSTVAMSVSLLRDPEVLLSDDERAKQLEVIGRSAQRMNRLIQDLLDAARIEGGRLTISSRCEDPAALAHEACEAFSSIVAERDVALACEVAPGLAPVYADRDRVLQVLSNYLNNAVKFTPAGGRIVLGLEATPAGGVRFRVSDSGPGIAAEDLPRLFTRFWQARGTAHLGSGLGLAIAKGIADAHRGRVWVESAHGQGSTFYLELPTGTGC